MKSSDTQNPTRRSTISVNGLVVSDGPRNLRASTSAPISNERQVRSVSLADIKIGTGHRQLDEHHVEELKESIARIGLTSPIIVLNPDPSNGATLLIAGQHRVKAALGLGWTHIDAFVLSAGDPNNRLVTISENLHRLNLSALDRAEQESEWLQTSKHEDAQLERPPGGHQPNEKGISKTAKKLDITRIELNRAEKIAAISPEAKLKVRELQLDKNQSALLKIAAGKTAEEQQQIAVQLGSRKREKAKPDRRTEAVARKVGGESLPSVDIASVPDGKPSSGDLAIPTSLNRCNPEKSLQVLVFEWGAAPRLIAAWENAPPLARARFIREVMRFVSERLETSDAD